MENSDFLWKNLVYYIKWGIDLKTNILKRLNEDERTSLALKSGVLYLIAEMITRGISFLVTPVFTRILPPAVFADSKIFESWVYLIAPVISLSLYQSMARARFDYKEKYGKFLSSILFLMTIITLVFFLACTPFSRKFENIFGFGKGLLALMLAYCLAYNGIQCVQLYDRQLLQYKRNVLLTFLGVVPGVVTSLFLILCFGSKVSENVLLNMRIVGFFLPTTLIGIFLIVYVFVTEKSFICNEFFLYGVKYSVPLMATAVASQVFFQSGNIIVRRVVGAEEAAIVVVAMTVGYIMDILIHAIDNAWKPWMFEQLNKGEIIAVKKFWKFLFLGIAFLVWLLTVFAPELTLFLGGTQYMSSIILISPILCSSLVNFLMISYTSLEQYYKKTKISGIASVVSAIADLVLSYMFIKSFGYQAVAYTILAAYLIACMIHFWFMRKYERDDVLQVKMSMGIILGTFGVCMSTTMLYSFSFIIRVLMVGSLLIILGLVFHKRFIEKFKVWVEREH